MKKLPKYASLALCIAYAFYPVCALIALLFGYRFAILSETLWYLLLIAGTIGCILLLRKTEESYFWCGLIPVFAMGNWICSMYTGMLPLILSILMFFTTIPLLMRHTGINWLKVATLGIVGLLCMPLMGLSLLGGMVRQTTPSEVVYTETSPNGTHYLEHIKNWQTEKEKNYIVIVKVYENSGFDIGICSAAKRPVKLYVGEIEKDLELEFEVRWKDDTCILIEGKEYPIN